MVSHECKQLQEPESPELNAGINFAQASNSNFPLAEVVLGRLSTGNNSFLDIKSHEIDLLKAVSGYDQRKSPRFRNAKRTSPPCSVHLRHTTDDPCRRDTGKRPRQHGQASWSLNALSLKHPTLLRIHRPMEWRLSNAHAM